MSSNKTIRQELERRCGKGCFFDRAHCAERIEAMGGIKTFRLFLEKKKYFGKKLSKQLTYHHLRHKSEGGKATVENGAVIEEIAHQYMHSLPRDQEEVINDMLREFKLSYGILSTEGIYDTGIQELDFDIKEEDALVIQTYNHTKEEYLQWMKEEAERKKREKYKRLKNPSRAMKKRQMQKIIEEEEELEI